MAAAASIKFTQGANVGADGKALVGVITTTVSIANVVNTGVLSWEINLVYVPVGSALSVTTLASNNNNSTPAATFAPDVTGSYRIQLRVWDAINRVGTATDTDIRVFAVPETRTGLIKPPYQAWPRPLPLTATGLAGAKDDELNFGGQAFGWAGAGSDGLLDDALKAIDQRVGISAGTQSAITGNVVFSNSNGISFGLSGSSMVTASYTVPSIAGLISAVNLSAGTTSSNLSSFVFSNSNNVSFGLNGATVTATISVPAQTNQTVGLYGIGNTTQNSSTTLDARSISLNGLGAATVGYSNGSVQISVPVQTAQTQSNVQGISAGTQVGRTGDIVFANSNGITFGMSGSSQVTGSYTVPSIVGLLSAINISAGTTSSNLSAVTFSNSNGLSFGLNGGTVTGSYTVPSTAGLISAVNFSAGTTSGNTNAVTFSNSNGISFGYNAGTITASYTVPSQTIQTIGMYALGNTTQNSSTTLDARTLSFNALGAITMGYSNGSIQVSAPTQTVQTQSNIAGIYDGANSISTGTIRFTNANGVSFSINGQTISGSVAAQTAQTQNIVVPSAGTQTATSGTAVWSNSNGISFGMSNSSVITASYTVPSTAGLISAINFSAGTTSSNISAVTFSNSNGLSFGLNGGTITGSYTVPSTAGLISAVNLSAGTTSSNVSAFVFSNSNNVSFGLNGATVTATITVPTQTNQTVGMYAIGNTTGQSSSSTFDARTLSVSGVGAVSVGYSGNNLIISAPNALTNVNISAGTTSNNLTAFVFSNSNNVSFGLNGSTVTATVTVPAQTNQTIGLYALGNTTQNSSSTFDARSISFNGLGAATVGYSNNSVQISVPVQTVQTQSLIAGIYDGANSISTGTIRFTNANGVSFSINGQTISGSVAAQTNQTIGLYAVSNTTQNSSTTLDARTLSFQGAGIASVGYSNGSVIISVPTGAPSPVNFSAGTTSGNLGSVVFSNANGVSFGLNGSTITASAAGGGATVSMYALGNTTQNSSTTLNVSALSFNGLGALTWGYSNGSIQASAPAVSSLSATGGLSISTNGSTISIGVPQLGTLMSYDVIGIGHATAGSGILSANTGTSGAASFFPFVLPAYVAGGWLNVVQSMAFLTVGTSSGRQTLTHSYAIYTRGTGTNNTTLGTITSGSYSIGVTGQNSSYTINQPTTSNVTGYGTNTTNSSGVNISSGYTGFKLVQFPINSTMSPGNYWLGLFVAASTSSVNVGISNTYIGVSIYASARSLAPIGSFSSNYSSGTNVPLGIGGNWHMGLGSYTSAGQTNLPGSIALSAISQDGAVFPYLKFVSTI